MMGTLLKQLDLNNKYLNYVFICLILLAIIYFFSIGKDPALGDSLVFTVQAYKGFEFESNATNHFLYSNFLALSHKILPFLNVHFLFVGISVFSGILSLFYLQKLLPLFEVTQKSTLICLLIFGFSFTFWRLSIITEVYTFYLLFVILFLINIFKFLKEKKPKYFYYLSFLFGLLFLIHVQTILFIPLYCYLIIRHYKILKIHAVYGIVITVFVFSILLIPVALGRNSLISIFTDGAYQDSIFNFDMKIIFKSLIKNIGFLIYNFLFFLVFMFLGLKNRNKIDYIIIAIAPFVFFCIKHNVSDVYVFHIIPYIFLLALIGRGMDSFPKTIYFFLPLLFPIIYFMTYKITKSTKTGENFEKEKGFKGGTKYMMFPPMSENPDLSFFIKKYKEDSLDKEPELKYMYPFALEWEKIKK
ncbi:DUF2723 domain-containing protein [Chryseobacterium sp. 2TAF14]|uniref:protein O-mannosyl-transferase family n=1 Tax=Chryseobacterium sp. 2TAF14 TaxID=3233007 RepID=UPI003F917FA4